MQPARASQVVIAIHYQNDILHPDSKFHVGIAQLSQRRANVIAAAQRLLSRARSHEVAIIHARIAFQSNHADLITNCALFKKVHDAGALLEGTWGAEFYDGLAPLPGEAVVTHTRNNAFHGSDLETKISEHGASRLIIAGIATNYSVEHSARHAVDLGYEVTVVSDASTTADPTLHDASLRSLTLLADIKLVDEVIADFTAHST